MAVLSLALLHISWLFGKLKANNLIPPRTVSKQNFLPFQENIDYSVKFLSLIHITLINTFINTNTHLYNFSLGTQ